MKTKHTNVRLSLFVIAAALVFGMGTTNAKGEQILFKKSLKEKIYHTGRYDNKIYQNPPGETIGTIEIGADEEVNKVKLLTISPDAGFHGRIEFRVKYPQFKDPSVMVYKSRDRLWKLTGEQVSVVGETWPIYGPATIKIDFIPATGMNNVGNNNYEFRTVDQIIQVVMKKERSSFAQSQTQLQALVLPKNTKNTRLVVESSEDLVNWKLDTPGPKTTTNRERFFRLRAVKE